MTREELREAIADANGSIKTTEIKGKNYAEVNQRIKAFRHVYPGGRIETSIDQLKDGVCIMSARVYDDGGDLLGSGHAYEREGSSFINSTSFIENCETSAVGRALGMCGFGIDTSVRSSEEMENAIAQQEEEKRKKDENKPMKTVQRNAIVKMMSEVGVTDADMDERLGKPWKEATQKEAYQLMADLEATKKAKA